MVPVVCVVVLAIQLCVAVEAVAAATTGIMVWLTVVSVEKTKLPARGFICGPGEAMTWDWILSLLTQIWADAMGFPAASSGVRVSRAVPLT